MIKNTKNDNFMETEKKKEDPKNENGNSSSLKDTEMLAEDPIEEQPRPDETKETLDATTYRLNTLEIDDDIAKAADNKGAQPISGTSGSLHSSGSLPHSDDDLTQDDKSPKGEKKKLSGKKRTLEDKDSSHEPVAKRRQEE